MLVMPNVGDPDVTTPEHRLIPIDVVSSTDWYRLTANAMRGTHLAIDRYNDYTYGPYLSNALLSAD